MFGICLFMITYIATPVSEITDNYPKNPEVDAINYAFRIDLSDDTDEIICEVTIDIGYLGEGVQYLRLDLINASRDLEGKGMQVILRVKGFHQAIFFTTKVINFVSSY